MRRFIDDEYFKDRTVKLIDPEFIKSARSMPRPKVLSPDNLKKLVEEMKGEQFISVDMLYKFRTIISVFYSRPSQKKKEK